VKIIRIAVHGRFSDGSEVPKAVQEYLAEAALDIMSASVAGKSKDYASRAFDILNSIDLKLPILPPGVFERYNTAETPMWMRRMLNAINVIQLAAIEVGGHYGSGTALWTLQEVMFKTIGLFRIMMQGICDDNEAASSAAILPHLKLYQENYIDYGCINATDLAYAQIRRYLIREDVPEDAIAEVSQIVEALSKKRSNSVNEAEALVREGLRIFDIAEDKATVSRSTQKLSDVFMAVHECHLLYVVAEAALNWAIDKYKKAGITIPIHVLKEHQVLEEYRADTIWFLERSGSSFIFGPTHALMYDTLFRHVNNLTDNRSLPERFNSAATNFAGRNPLYPQTLLEGWREIAESVEYIEGELPTDELHSGIRRKLTACFSDKAFVSATLKVFDKWGIDWA